MAPKAQTLYFAYGSNLSLVQMNSRCPASKYHSFGVLKGWKWVIGPRGYANVVKSTSTSDMVYGMLYTLTPSDEECLDLAEGVPYCYVKKTLEIELLKPYSRTAKALVYVDVARPGEGVCKEEYVARMNRGIKDAIAKGMPEQWVKDAMRKWVRDEEVEQNGEGVEDPFLPVKK